MGEGSRVLTLLSLAREREREKEGGRKSGVLSHMWKKSTAVYTGVCSAPGTIVALSDLMEDVQA